MILATVDLLYVLKNKKHTFNVRIATYNNYMYYIGGAGERNRGYADG